MPHLSSIRLVDLEPELARYVPVDERAMAAEIRLPMRTVPQGDIDLTELLDSTHSFAAIIHRGMLLQWIRLGTHSGLRLLGPGDPVALSDTLGSGLLLDAGCRATVPSSLVILGDRFLLACRRWPRLITALHARSREQSERLTTQLMICQLPRVESRLLSLFWLLAESWGRVTPSGTAVPIDLTHGVLGGLVGARRPTVTLALQELTARGAIVRQREGWLLLESVPPPIDPGEELPSDPQLIENSAGPWSAATHEPPPAAPRIDELAYGELRRTVLRLRTEHDAGRLLLRERLTELADARERCRQTRLRITTEARTRQPAPSS
jgi:CRP/FNR family transcriptional regulator, cyclic AMP receptor protein